MLRQRLELLAAFQGEFAENRLALKGFQCIAPQRLLLEQLLGHLFKLPTIRLAPFRRVARR
jgi:hypothetical protein